MNSSDTLAQEADDEEAIEEIVTTGTRREGQSPTETLSPIDVLAGDALANQATFDMTDGLTKIAPSINTQRFPIADGTAFIRPVTLRNLSPDQTLVLVNGTRRHRSPLVNLQFAPLGTVNQGAQAVDFSSIPSAAVKRIEVLRDGASAQYGSDAIAGVVNIILKDAAEGVSLSAQTGEYFEGDGSRTTIDANIGLPLGGSGFINITAERSTADKTSRGGPWFACPAIIEAVGRDAVPLDGNCIRWGDPDVETTKFFVNAGIDVSESVELYGNLSFSDNETLSDFFYREPVLPPSAGVGGEPTLIVDSDGDFLPDPVPQGQVDALLADGVDLATYLTADASSPSGWVFLNPIFSQFPGGYNPDFGADISDRALVIGLRGETAGGLTWDLTARTAESEAKYVLSQSINPSLGTNTPFNFTPGKLTQEENELNADFVKSFEVGSLASPLNFAFGLELREETYEIGAGDPASTQIGPVRNFRVWSDGFQGFPPEAAGSFDSQSVAAYIDVEADITDRFTAGAAVRYEDYDEFGNTFDGKISGRVQVNDQFAVRATFSTGFRAPTPGQVNTLNTTTSADASGNLTPTSTFPVGSLEAQVLGSVPLRPEDSTSFTLGVVWSLTDRTSITLDYYDIEVEDRLALLGPLTITQSDVDAMTAAGVQNADLLLGGLASYFANAFDSDISGFDLSITSDFDVGNGVLTVDFRHNQNEQEVGDILPNTITPDRVFDLENQVPDSRSTLTFDYQSGGIFSGHVRLNNYGDWETTEGLFSGGTADDIQSYGSELLVDVEATLTFNDRFRLTVGGENIFDTEPDDELGGTLQAIGIRKALTSPFGFNGGFWYARLAADF
ncbi:MAG: TonB-dependent receptor [Gammaproteobacteria bacterium]|nr:TonB-dependent receptor [Gammaproteobacteria bacterium]